jgi:hypothetical protein
VTDFHFGYLCDWANGVEWSFFAGPAFVAGLREKDWIYAINGEILGFRPHEEVLKLIKKAGDHALFLTRSKSPETCALATCSALVFGEIRMVRFRAK